MLAGFVMFSGYQRLRVIGSLVARRWIWLLIAAVIGAAALSMIGDVRHLGERLAGFAWPARPRAPAHAAARDVRWPGRAVSPAAARRRDRDRGAGLGLRVRRVRADLQRVPRRARRPWPRDGDLRRDDDRGRAVVPARRAR